MRGPDASLTAVAREQISNLSPFPIAQHFCGF